MQLTIGILSRNVALYSTEGLIEAIEQAGHIPKVIDHLKCDIVMVGSSNYITMKELDYITQLYHGLEHQ